MLAWLFSFFRPSRLFFRYFDGVKDRMIDPVAAHRRIYIECPTLLEDGVITMDPRMPDGTRVHSLESIYDAEDRLREATRKVFDVKEWTETQPGLTVDETDLLLSRFVVFCAELKKKRNRSPMPSQPSTSTEPAPSMDTDDCQDGQPSGSSCSPTESTSAAPTGP